MLIEAKYRERIAEANSGFSHKSITNPIALITIPKTGTHLLSPIFEMFVPTDQQDVPLQRQRGVKGGSVQKIHQGKVITDIKYMFGHLPFNSRSASALSMTKKLILVRDPYAWVLAAARHLSVLVSSGSPVLRPKAEQKDTQFIETHSALGPHDLIALLIAGNPNSAQLLTKGIKEVYLNWGINWIAAGAPFVRYEDIMGMVAHVREGREAEARPYFENLFGEVGISLPEDWAERVIAGADPEKSGTARQNLKGDVSNIPDELTPMQKQLVDAYIPNVRNFLGYK
jgi:hypothetical protein